MLSDDVTNLLSRFPELRVISRATARAFTARPKDLKAVARELGVTHILQASVRSQGQGVRINAELIDTASLLAIWSARIDRDEVHTVKIADEIAASLARQLQIGLHAIAAIRQSPNTDANALAHKGWSAMYAGFNRSSPEAYRKAEDYFNEALKLDPKHVSARMGLGAFHANVGAQLMVADPGAHLAKSEQILNALLADNPEAKRAYFHLGLTYQARGELERAVEAFKSVLEFEPSQSSAHAHIGHALGRSGQPARGLEHIRYAMRLSPRDPSFSFWLEFQCNAELELSLFAQAIEHCRQSARMNPGYPRSTAGLAAALALSGNMQEATEQFARLQTFAPELSPQQIAERYGRHKRYAAKVRDGLKLLADQRADAVARH
jgi:tetratricopeptide (TPR) repeat protein